MLRPPVLSNPPWKLSSFQKNFSSVTSPLDNFASVCVCVWVWEREIETDRQTGTETDRKTEREGERERELDLSSSNLTAWIACCLWCTAKNTGRMMKYRYRTGIFSVPLCSSTGYIAQSISAKRGVMDEQRLCGPLRPENISHKSQIISHISPTSPSPPPRPSRSSLGPDPYLHSMQHHFNKLKPIDGPSLRRMEPNDRMSYWPLRPAPVRWGGGDGSNNENTVQK